MNLLEKVVSLFGYYCIAGIAFILIYSAFFRFTVRATSIFFLSKRELDALTEVDVEVCLKFISFHRGDCHIWWVKRHMWGMPFWKTNYSNWDFQSRKDIIVKARLRIDLSFSHRLILSHLYVFIEFQEEWLLDDLFRLVFISH